ALQNAVATHYAVGVGNAAATTESYALSLHDALPISASRAHTSRRIAALTWRRAGATGAFEVAASRAGAAGAFEVTASRASAAGRSEEHTSELQSRENLVCRLPLEKKKTKRYTRSPRA